MLVYDLRHTSPVDCGAMTPFGLQVGCVYVPINC